MKKILTFACLLFFFLTVPESAMTGYPESHSLSSSTTFAIAHGFIENHGQELREEGLCYNITPIHLIIFVINNNFGRLTFYREKIITNPIYIPKDAAHGFVGRHFLLLCEIDNLAMSPTRVPFNP
jgi:hypothetical protein